MEGLYSIQLVPHPGIRKLRCGPMCPKHGDFKGRNNIVASSSFAEGGFIGASIQTEAKLLTERSPDQTV